MKRILFSILFLLCSHLSNAQTLPKVENGTLVRIDNLNSNYVPKRKIDVWLPIGYDANKKYSVLYMQDGEMLFDTSITWNKKSWLVHDPITKLVKENKIKEVIVVGIWNGGERRHSEYFPQKPFEMLSLDQKATIKEAVRKNNASVFNNHEVNSNNYLKFIVEELKPYIDKNFSTNSNANNTFIAGSSMGGLISMYAICEYPNVFGGAICMSTHWPGIFEMENNPIPAAFLQYLNEKLPSAQNHKLYFDCGDQTLDALYPPLQNKVDELMRKKGYTQKSWMTKYFTNQDHSEVAWSGRVHIPLQFMLQK
ncbi:MAG: alpha/beta hydrolase [Sediminibacterium sp.]